MSELRECPWCGQNVTIEQEENGFHYINCDTCDVTISPFIAASHARAVWNRRQQPPALAMPESVRDDIEELCGFVEFRATLHDGKPEPSTHWWMRGWMEKVNRVRAHLAATPLPTALDAPDRPTVVCLCGSTRFWREFQRHSLIETMAGKIVLSIGAASGTDDEHFGNLPREEYERVKSMLDELHMRKIDMADEVLVISQEGYIGTSTRREIGYALASSKGIRWMEESAKESYYANAEG